MQYALKKWIVLHGDVIHSEIRGGCVLQLHMPTFQFYQIPNPRIGLKTCQSNPISNTEGKFEPRVLFSFSPASSSVPTMGDLHTLLGETRKRPKTAPPRKRKAAAPGPASKPPRKRKAYKALAEEEEELRSTMREKCRGILVRAGGLSEKKAAGIARRIEMELYFEADHLGNRWVYTTTARKILGNLDPSGHVKNPTLLPRLLSGDIQPEYLATMTHAQMWPEKWTGFIDGELNRRDRWVIVKKDDEHHSDAFKCGKCKKSKVTYYSMQTRSGDEPMTNFIRCVNCDNRWRVG
jgi:transcription elongation factor S-II